MLGVGSWRNHPMLLSGMPRKKVTPADFVAGRPGTEPVADMIEAAARIGVRLTPRGIEALRRKHKIHPATPRLRRANKPQPSEPDPIVEIYEKAIRRAVLKIGLVKARAVLDELQREADGMDDD